MKKWKISDFVLIGLLAAIDAAVIYGVGMLTAAMVPVMHVFTSSITALIMGTVVLFAGRVDRNDNLKQKMGDLAPCSDMRCRF